MLFQLISKFSFKRPAFLGLNHAGSRNVCFCSACRFHQKRFWGNDLHSLSKFMVDDQHSVQTGCSSQHSAAQSPLIFDEPGSCGYLSSAAVAARSFKTVSKGPAKSCFSLVFSKKRKLKGGHFYEIFRQFACIVMEGLVSGLRRGFSCFQKNWINLGSGIFRRCERWIFKWRPI